MIDLDAIRERDRGCSPGAIHRPSLYWAVQDRRVLLAEVDRLRQYEPLKGGTPLPEFRLQQEVERLRAELAIVTRDRDTLLQMTRKTVQQVADEINRLRSSRS